MIINYLHKLYYTKYAYTWDEICDFIRYERYNKRSLMKENIYNKLFLNFLNFLTLQKIDQII
jgi:hypothetical protein